jgi:predicted RecB family nuclease
VQLIDGRVILSPTDLIGFLACEHLTQLELMAARAQLTRPDRDDPELDLIARKGLAHEVAQLQRLRVERGSVAEIAGHDGSLAGLVRAEAQTLAAMRAGVAVIYQAAFFDGTWSGRADFLRRVATPSDLGAWSYEVADTKLARSVKASALLQMCEYSLQVSRLQGCAPVRMHVIRGDGSEEPHQVADCDAYHRAARRRLEATVLGRAVTTYPDPVHHCHLCRWEDACIDRRRADDHLCLVAGMRRDQTRRLVEAGITTVAELAATRDGRGVDIAGAPYERMHRQARLQVDERRTGSPHYELLPIEAPGLGLGALPAPSAGDLFFDIEGDPFVEDGGLEYLFGISELAEGALRFHPFWAHSRAEERAAFERLVDFIIERLERDPALHVYHYANYEKAALKKLMGRHATREDEVDRLLRGGVLIDLYGVVRQGVAVSCESYSLKSLEALYMAAREDVIAGAGESIAAFERWIETADPVLLDSIGKYNERDCESTWRLRDWLEARRAELAERKGVAIPRPQAREGEPSEALAEATSATRQLFEALTTGVPDDPALRDDVATARRLLAHLLDWHRREDKSAWWAYYERCAKTDEGLVDDPEAIGGVVHLGPVRTEKLSTVHRYRFDPTQDYKLGVGDSPHDPRTGSQCGTIVHLDSDAGVLELKRGPSLAAADHPGSLIPGGPFPTDPLRDALRRVAAWVIKGGMDSPGAYRAVRDLLLCREPRLRGTGLGERGVPSGADPVAAVCGLASDLDECCLPVQGPPGCGKTHTGGELVVEMIRQGWRVGVCATTHRAIGELVADVCEAAARRGVTVRALQKCDPEQFCGVPGVQRTDANAAVAQALADGTVDVVAGTPWLFATEAFDGGLDAVVIDEAGQMALANAVAVGTAARNLVLLGDPQQLAQPSQGIHPEGAGGSALQHLLAGRDTIPPDRGVFLGITWRMHPEVCRFVSTVFYERRLSSHPDAARQRVLGSGPLSGTGLRLVEIPHAGDRTWSPAEANAVSELVNLLRSGAWTDTSGETRPLTLDDILVVAPYNAHVKRLRERLPEGARVGTVDRFQGQEAPVTVYTMASSSAEDMPRNLEFLFSGNRLNVAVSRARAVSILVCSPELFRARCATPEQLRLVNALCRYSEMATALTSNPVFS